ncbi:hypothetical protein [Chlorogloea sp. CCALA 695]|uniref:hypothetical protein n=1 Tax=Chlorogloea sp. CCALA 695 TaxID=2107693 RepID=UPI000D053309|nr:hypothetical protein [Chlorogloea sp. CCALA 695]PSB32132.1 hypothetical protein C7B70_11395 [Chlorogloea sp. CCALA 695]
MKKLFVVCLSVALSLVVVDTAFSNPPSQQPEPAALVQAEVETPLCYLQTPDGKTWDLNGLCEQAPQEANSSKSNVAFVNPYNSDAIKKFDDDLYGDSN